MLLTVTTTHRPATDLGYLLVKHPDKVHSFEMPTGTAYVMYPEAAEDRCTAALLLDVDPQKLRARADAFELSQYVNDRPYAASSLLASALSKVFRSALRGASKDRPELAAEAIPLEIRVPVLRGSTELVTRLFAPLGWAVTATPLPFEPEIGGDSRYVDLLLTGTLRLADALNHLYVLLPVLDDGKHYWVAPDEIEKLLRAGSGWLAGHPERILIARRYLAHRKSLATTALELLEADQPVTEEESELPVTRKAPLAEQRRDAVLAALAEVGAARVLDLGCGPGALLSALLKDARFTEIVGADVSSRALEQAARRLRLERMAPRQRDRIKLVQTALTYHDDRLNGYDAAVLMEVIEHIDLPRLPALEASVFGRARPGAVIVTTPNVEYNVHYEGLTGMRHSDHRFEWTRAEFATWANEVAERYGYTVTTRGVGDPDETTGAPTQLALFTKTETSTEVTA
ncbi:3' terminal RNA ribose 2'-O-methyltransferase Hen1 [Actinoplanes regularis]|uniref:Small RNA 2'-O-methyltransferase n=1 Tax=Actinoplanes regularis TaxID=52697 RepID=A0A239H6K3_9ACTN|nr:3' terminal RNA ribose 2'-O-methyltransferase Hen1 [Actinoplanes regularis]GIE92151.1 3' terminal RNA ribose 2'-O-methyltransferase Hen1 [Actinoplanes regularis]SNS76801.1 3' terminal RNA ribose 2'-O-methyltransferase Hen1 [Actinoplanes regularis]